MGKKRTDRGPRPVDRTAAVRQTLPLMLIVCEGEVTEPEYIRGFRRVHGTRTVRVHVESPGGDPLTLVETASRLKDQAEREAVRYGDPLLAYDEVWCVLDVDEHRRLSAAYQVAQVAGVRIALSNPCFEFWLLLHFVDHRAHLDQREAGRLVRQHLPGYDKHIQFEIFAQGYPLARDRANAIERYHAGLGQQGANPSTGVHRLTERIREFGKDARLNAPR